MDRARDGREHRERVEWPPGVGEHHRLVEEQLLLADGIGDTITRQPVRLQRVVDAEQPPHQVAGADLDDLSEERIVVGRDRHSCGQDFLRLDRRPDLVQRFAEEQADLRRHAVAKRRTRQPLDGGEIVSIAGQAGRADEQVWVGRARRLEAGRRRTDGVLAPPGPVRLEVVGVLEEQAATGEHRHACSQDLAVHRMAERHDLAPTIQPHGQQAGAVEQFELFVADQILQRRQTHRFPDGQPIERRGRRS